jgi:hypothetical protein
MSGSSERGEHGGGATDAAPAAGTIIAETGTAGK